MKRYGSSIIFEKERPRKKLEEMVFKHLVNKEAEERRQMEIDLKKFQKARRKYLLQSSFSDNDDLISIKSCKDK